MAGPVGRDWHNAGNEMSRCSSARRAAAEEALRAAKETGDQSAIKQAEAELASAKKEQDGEITAVIAAVVATM
jgi:predicted negative regulator of RcsB-dependent stress response